jgi:hypothetical protein
MRVPPRPHVVGGGGWGRMGGVANVKEVAATGAPSASLMKAPRSHASGNI